MSFIFISGLLPNVLMQLVSVSLVGWLTLKLLTQQSAPLRALISLIVLAMLVIMPILTVGFHTAQVSWYETPLYRLPAIRAIASAQSAPRTAPSHSAITTPAVKTISAPTAKIKLNWAITMQAALVIWLTGMVVMLARLFYGLAFLRRFRNGLQSLNDARFHAALETAGGHFGLQRVPLLAISTQISSPLAVGTIAPMIVIPADLPDRVSDDEITSIMLHEVAHIAGFDHITGIFKRLVLTLYWWNPLIYRLVATHSLAREEIADGYVLEQLSPQIYSSSLLALAEKSCLINRIPTAVEMAGHYSNFEQRIRIILTHGGRKKMKNSKKRMGVLIVCGMVVTIALAGGSPGKEKSATEKKKMEKEDCTATRLSMKGSKLTPEQVEKMEKQLKKNPEDLELRSLLLGYYCSAQYSISDLSIRQKIKEKRQESILWLIRNHPEAPILVDACGYFFERPEASLHTELTQLWKTQVTEHPRNVRILWNAARNLSLADKKLSIEFLIRGCKLEPHNSLWYRQLGYEYDLDSQYDLSLSAYQQAYKLDSEIRLSYLAMAAFKAKDYQLARLYSEKMLKEVTHVSDPTAIKDKERRFTIGRYIFDGNNILGLIAMKEGKMEEAEKYLLASGTTNGSATLNSFGPSLLLASQVFNAGKKETVVKFFREISRFWEKDSCERSIKKIEAGENPFVGNDGKNDSFSIRLGL